MKRKKKNKQKRTYPLRTIYNKPDSKTNKTMQSHNLKIIQQHKKHTPKSTITTLQKIDFE